MLCTQPTFAEPAEMWQTERAQALGLQIVATGELLINVLCQLDQRTLLCSAVRVCHRWNDLVGTSADIRRRHFLSPVPEVDASLPSKLDWDDSNDNETPPVRLNALLTEIFRPFFTPSNRPALNAFGSIFSCSLDWSGDGATRRDPNTAKFRRLLRPDASWRRMLTQQPPVRRLGLWVQRQGDLRPPTDVGAATATAMAVYGNGSFLVVEYPDGLRMGELYDLCLGLGPPLTPNLSFRPFWSPQTPALGHGGLAATTTTTTTTTCAAHDRELVNMLQSAALQLAGAGEWQGVDAVLRLFKLNTSWALSANQVRRLDFMRQFSFPETEAEAEAAVVV